MADDLKGTKVAILATDGVERIELEQRIGARHAATTWRLHPNVLPRAGTGPCEARCPG